MRTKLSLSLVVIILLLATVSGANARFGATAPSAPQAAVGAGFTFQGQLKNAGAPVNGNCDMTFRLYDAAATGAQIGSTITTTVPVSNSLFTVMLNANGEYGANAFNGDARWLEVSVKCAGDVAFTVLTPRQQVTAAPYAQYSVTTDSASALSMPYYPLMRPQVLDLRTFDPTHSGSMGFTDGRYGYIVPWNSKLVRIDLEDFITTTVTSLDLSVVDADLSSFRGGFTDGHYGYLVPGDNGAAPGTSGRKIVRVDLQDFSPAGITVLNLSAVDPSLYGYTGGFTDGRYGYFVPNGGGTVHGKAVRVDLLNFTTDGVTTLDLAAVDLDLKGFYGGFTDGTYAYFSPHENNGSNGWNGKIARVDLRNFAPSGVTVLNLASVDSELVATDAHFVAGKYAYFATGFYPGVIHGKIARVDLQNFTTSGVTVVSELTTIDPGLKGFYSAVSDGRYGYFATCCDWSGGRFGKIARVDLASFSLEDVVWMDATTIHPDLKGFNGVFSDGRFAYLLAELGVIGRIQLFSGIGTP